MSETLSQDPELNTGYTNLASNYPPTPATPSSTVQDGPPGTNLPPFSTFNTDMDSNGGAFNSTSSDRLFSDTRLLDISNWDYYTAEARLLDRTENGLSIISSQPQYRPWESKSVDSSTGFTSTTPINTFADAFNQSNGISKLPSFQSQFQTFNDPTTVNSVGGGGGGGGEATTLTTLTNLTPVSPNSSSSPSHLTTLNTNFHTLSAVNPRNYPLVPAPIQAREIPSIQQQFLDERHIQLYSHPTTNLTNLNNTIHSASIFPTQNGTIIQNISPTVVTVLKQSEHPTDIKLTSTTSQPTQTQHHTTIHEQNLKIQNIALHPTQFQNPMTTIQQNDNGIYNGLDKKLNGLNATMSPSRNDFRKKERRKMRASSLESSAESDGASSNMEISENSGQVAAVSSTAGFKTHHLTGNNTNEIDEISGGNPDKQVKKKRKRCGECIGCQRKDNCGDCAPCRNDKSHQICKQRRCEKLTEKKNLYGDASYLRGESRRGRGKGRGAGSYRGRKPSGPISSVSSGPGSGISPEANANVTVIPNQQQPSRPSPQPAPTVHMLKPEQQPIPVQQQSPMTPMPFYADPNRFPTPVWQADPAQAWPQGQFIQQISTPQPIVEGYQQYPNGIYQTTYQQPGFEANTFYTTGPVQVLTNTRPPSAPNQQAQLTPRPNSNYSHTPSPAPPVPPQQNPPPPPQQQQQNRSYQEYNAQNQSQQQQQQQQPQQQPQQSFVSPASTPSVVDNNNSGNISRPSSVNSTISNPSGQNFQQPNTGGQGFTQVSQGNFSPSSQQVTSYTSNSGNAEPGYPQVNSSPQLVSHNSSGYPGNGQYSGASQSNHQWSDGHHHHHHHHPHHVMWEPQPQQQQHRSDGLSPIKEYHNQQQDDNNIAQTSNKEFSQSDRVNLNTRIKTMILSKQQQDDGNDEKKIDQSNNTGHFLWYSHHHRLNDNNNDGGGPHQNYRHKQSQRNCHKELNMCYSLCKQCEKSASIPQPNNQIWNQFHIFHRLDEEI